MHPENCAFLLQERALPLSLLLLIGCEGCNEVPPRRGREVERALVGYWLLVWVSTLPKITKEVKDVQEDTDQRHHLSGVQLSKRRLS